MFSFLICIGQAPHLPYNHMCDPNIGVDCATCTQIRSSLSEHYFVEGVFPGRGFYPKSVQSEGLIGISSAKLHIHTMYAAC